MRLLLKAFLFLILAKMALRWVAVKRIVLWKQRALRSGCERGDGADQCARVRWAVLTATRYAPIQFVCFPQCLAASELLHQCGVPSRLHYGVRREGAKLRTHTWLEAGGAIVIGGEVADEFSELDVY